MTLCKLAVCKIFFLALVGKCSNTTRRACRCLLPAIFPASHAVPCRRDSAKLPPAGQGTAMRPHSYTPAGISEHLSPPRLAFQTAQGHLPRAPAFFKGRPNAWGIYYHQIPSPSGSTTPGRVFSLILMPTPGRKLSLRIPQSPGVVKH